MKTIRKYLFYFTLLTFVGGLYLRWYQLTYFYRIPETYLSGIGTTLGAIAVLMSVIGVLDYKILKNFYKTINKIKNGESITSSERAKALSASKLLNTICVIANIIGFVIGQIIASTMDIINGVIIAVPSRLIFIFVEASLVGACFSLYEIFFLEHLISDDRRLLNIHETRKMNQGFYLTIRAKLLLTSFASLLLMGLHCFCASYQIILQDGGQPVNDIMGEYLATILPVFLFTFIPCFGLIVLLSSNITHRLKNTVIRLKDIAECGDLTSRINITSKDEIGELNSGLNVLMKQLSILMNSLKKETEIVSSSADQLMSSVTVSTKALDEMKVSVEEVSSKGEYQGSLVAEVSNDINYVTSSALEVEQQVSVQASAVQQTSASVNQMAENIKIVAEMTQKADGLSNELKSTSTKGSTAITTAVNSIMEIRSASQAVQEIITIIKKLASQTNLLSMNAAIEAAHAGTYGMGFAVVADEVRSLANSSSNSAKDIQDHIKTMAQKIDNGVESIQAAGEAFSEISRSIEDTSSLIKTISNAMDEQRIGASETIQSTESVVEAIHQIQEQSRKQREYAEKVSDSISHVVTSFGEISTSLKENSDNSYNLEKAISNVYDCVASNYDAVDRMRKEIQVFKV